MSKLNEKCAINGLTHTLPASTSSNCVGSLGKSTSLGVHKFCSKLRHKIEDNLTTARLANKFAKASRHSISMSSLSGLTDATIGKYTNKSNKCQDEAQDENHMPKKSGMLKYKRIINKSTQHLRKETHEPVVTSTTTTPAVCFVGTYIDSDDEYPLPSLSLTKQSLEDEIFEELEKVAHDEQKLNTVLKTFDRILTDFHDDVEAQHLMAVSKAALQQTNHESELTKMAQETEKVVDSNVIRRPKLEKCRTTLCELSNSKKLNKSVLDMTVVSKIPVWKALPLSKRSKSFCYAPIEQTLQKITSLTSSSVSSTVPTMPQNKMLRKRAVSYTTLPQHTAQKQSRQPQAKPQLKAAEKVTSAKLIKSKTELNVKRKINATNVAATKSTLKTNTTTNLRRSQTNSDELLDKCLEKGQQILRKIESLGTAQQKPLTSTLKARKKTSTVVAKSDKNLNVKQTSPILDLKYMAQKGRQNSDALSDDSGHISNEAQDTQASPLSESASSTMGSSCCDFEPLQKPAVKSSKIYKLLQKFENKTLSSGLTSDDNKMCNKTTTTVSVGEPQTQQTPAKQQTICTSLKVAEVAAVHCIKTHIEIFPNYSKEVTTWFY